METPFLEIPDSQSSSVPGGEDQDGLDIFDISYLLDLTETANKQSNDEKYVIFKLDEDIFGVSLGNVVEVCRSLPVTPLPNTPLWLAGIANMRGSLLSVIDLQAFEPSSIQASKPKMIVLTDGGKQVSIGLLVDQILEIAFLPNEGIVPFPTPKLMGARHFVSGKSPYKASSLLVLDAQKLFSSPQLNNPREH
jgi:purine-binding chemotaxis protein CheW